jgi:hypothetical protein
MSGGGVTLTPHPLLAPWSRKGRTIPLLPYGPYGLYIASVPVQGWPLPLLLNLRKVIEHCGRWVVLPSRLYGMISEEERSNGTAQTDAWFRSIPVISSLKNCSWHFMAVDAAAVTTGPSVKSDTPNTTAVFNRYKRNSLLVDPRHFSRGVHQTKFSVNVLVYVRSAYRLRLESSTEQIRVA